MATTAMKHKTGRKALRDLTNNNNNINRSSKVKPSISTTLTKTKKKQQLGEEEEKHPQKPVAYYEEEEEEEAEEDGDNDGVLDGLLLVQSDLTSLLHQIDDLVVQALKLNDTGKKGRKEIKSFAHALSVVSSSLKPWMPRLQEALLSSTGESENQFGETLSTKTTKSASEADDDDIFCSPEQTNSDLLISPSPLVSWRVNCTIDRSRQLFLLTPLPMSKASSQCQRSRFASQKINHVTIIQPLPELEPSENENEGMTRKPTPFKPSGAALVEMGSSKEPGCTSHEFSKRNIHIVETNCIKTSPPKSCILLEPISKSPPDQTVDKVYKSTPFPVRNRNIHEPPDSAFVETGSSKEFGFTSPESSKRNFTTIVATPCFKTSPPNTCILLEPTPNSFFHQAVDKVRKSTPYPVGKQNLREPDTPESSGNELSGALILKYPELGRIQRGPKSVAEKKKYETSPDWFLSLSPPKTCVLMEPPVDKSLHNQNAYGGSNVLTDATPMRKEPESVIRTGRRPGENTLKKELWAKFEAATTGLCFASEFQKTKHKGFLDLLEEASSDESESDFKEGLR